MKKKNTLNLCSLCGLCKAECPVFQTTLNETTGPRGRSIQIRQKVKDLDFYKCSLCGACAIACPASIDTVEDFRRFRRLLVEAGLETLSNKQMMGNIRKYGNPFGKQVKGKLPKELFCC